MSDRKTEEKTVLSSQAVTAAANSSSMYVGDYTEATAYLDVTAVSGTAPVLAAKLQISHDDTDWFDHPDGRFPPIVVADNYCRPVKLTGKYIRVRFEVFGTSPSFTTEGIIQAKS